MTYTMPFDELNNLRTELAENFAPRLQNKETHDEALEELIEIFWVLYGAAYLNGVKEANVQLAGASEADPDKFREAALQEIAGEDFIDRVTKYADTGDMEAIYRVADTDAHRIYVGGELDAAIDNGAATKTWNTMEDWHVRESHEPLAGVTVGINEYFATYDGDEARMPGDFTLAENNVNCRCWLTFDY